MAEPQSDWTMQIPAELTELTELNCALVIGVNWIKKAKLNTDWKNFN